MVDLNTGEQFEKESYGGKFYAHETDVVDDFVKLLKGIFVYVIVPFCVFLCIFAGIYFDRVFLLFAIALISLLAVSIINRDHLNNQ